MSNEPDNRVQDQRVTEAYRAMANERAPEHLTARVLKHAAGVRTPYARARAWMRPVAWAATVGLSLAIVLELTQVPTPGSELAGSRPSADSNTPGRRTDAYDGDAAPAPGEIAESLALEAKKEDDTVDNTAREPAVTAAGRSTEALTTQDFAPRAEAVMQEAEALARARAGANRGSADVAAQADELSPESTLTDQMSTDLAAAHRDAADRRKARQVSEEARNAAASFAAISAAAGDERACAETERETPGAWYACIQELRESGQDEQADKEDEEFRQVYPDFDDSVTDK